MIRFLIPLLELSPFFILKVVIKPNHWHFRYPMGDHYFNRSPSYYKLIKCSIRLLYIISSMYLPFIWHADKVYLQRYQNMCYDVIYHCEIEQIFPPVKRTSFCEASLLQRKQRSTIGVGRKNLLSSAFNLQIFEDGISDDIDLWNFRFWSSPDFYNFSPWLNLKNRHLFCLKNSHEKEIERKIDASKYTTILGSKKSIFTMY